MNWAIIKKQFLIDTRRSGTYIWLIIFPIAMILILGSVLSNNFNSAPTKNEKVHVTYQIQDRGNSLPKTFDQFASQTNNKTIQFSKVFSANKALDEVKQGHKTAYANVTKNKITMYSANPDVLQSAVLSGYLNGFLNEYTVDNAIIKNGGNPSDVVQDVKLKKSAVQTGNNKHEKLPTSFQYYSLSIIAMICILTMQAGSEIFSGEKNRHTLSRIFFSPVNRFSMIISSFFEMLMMRIAAIAVLMVICNHFFGVDWGPHPIWVFLNYFALLFFAMMVGITIDLLSNSSPSVSIITNILAQVIVFMGGSYFPVGQSQAMLSPLGWTMNAVRDAVYNDSLITNNWPFWTLMGLSILLVLLAGWKVRSVEVTE